MNVPKNKSLSGCPAIDKPVRYYSDELLEAIDTSVLQSIYENIFQQNENNMDSVAMIYFGTKISYKELFNNIDRVAAALCSYGVNRGDFISLCLPNIPEIVYFIYAANKIGASVNLIDPRTNSTAIMERITECEAKLFVTILDICDEKINEIVDTLPCKKIVVVSSGDSMKLSSFISLALFVRDGLKRQALASDKYIFYKLFLNTYSRKPQFSSFQAMENATAIVVYTSGTTGTSKGVMLSNENLNNAERQLRLLLKSENTKRFLAIIPFFSAYGAVNGMHTCFSAGLEVTMIPKYNPKHFTNLILKYKPNIVLAVPKLWVDFAYKLKNRSDSLSFLIHPISGGDKIPPSLINAINDCLKTHYAQSKLLVGYGASEFGGAAVLTIPHFSFSAESTGVALPSTKVIVIDPDSHRELNNDVDGEICIHSSTMMLGYFKHQEETDNLIVIGKDNIKYYRTGDKGHISDNGEVTIIDRYKRVMMRPDGHTVHATPIENVISSHPSIRTCAVVGLKICGCSGVIPTAFIVPKSDVTDFRSMIGNLDAFCLQNLPEREKAIAYVLTNSLPYTLMGKVDYGKLEEKRIDEADAIITDFTFIDKSGKARR